MASQSPSPNPSPMNMKKTTRSLLLSLPDELMQEILSRLTLKSKFSCKLACKRLMDMVSDPELAFHPSSVSCTSLLYSFPSGCLALFDLRGGKAVNHSIRVPLGHFVNSCNGFLCVISPGGRQVTVCNPILSESMTLPRVISNYNEEEVCGAAIGFVASGKQFKVLAVVRHGKKPNVRRYEARVYVIGGAVTSWRSLGPAPFGSGHFAFRVKYVDTYVNGAVHWLDNGDPSRPFVIRAFDFESEQFRVLAVPQDPSFCGVGFQVVEGCLAFSGLRGTWIMKEYGVQGSWTKIYREKIEAPFWANRWLGEGCNVSNPLLSFKQIQAVAHVPSLVSLRSIANQENVETQKRPNDDKYLVELGKLEMESVKGYLQPVSRIEREPKDGQMDWLLFKR